MLFFSNIVKKTERNGFILLILFSLQPVFNFIKTNIYDQVFNFNRTLSYFFLLFILSLFVIYLLKNIFRNKNLLNITLFISFFWFYTFNYYIINNFFEIKIQKIFNSKNVGEISFITYILLFISIFYILSKIINLIKLRIVLYSILVTFISFDILFIIPNYYYSLNYNPIVKFEMPPKVSGKISRDSTYPNVYFLIPDAMPAQKNLQNIFFENYEYNEINELKNLGFNIRKNVKSHALNSYTSIPHFFSMDYLFKKNGKISPSLHVEINNIFNGYNSVVAEFRKRKYKYVRVDGGGHVDGCVGVEDICITGRGSFVNNQDLVFLERSYFIRILDYLSRQNKLLPILIFFKLNTNLNISNPDGKEIKIHDIPDGYKNFIHLRKDLQIMDSVIVYDLFQELLPNISESPYFFHWWMPFPHSPIRFNKECDLIYPLKGQFARKPNELNYEIWSDSYYGQTKCAEKELVKYAKKIIEHDEKAIILIHSDHGIDHLALRTDGPRNSELPDESYDNLLGVFSAYRVPKRCDKFFNTIISPVNSFRVIFACLDDKKYDFLPHKIFINNSNHTQIEGILEKNELGKYILKDFNDE